MYTLLVIIIVVAALLMIGIVLIQESKGGGLASNFSGANQVVGVRKTTDIVEKATWGLAVAMVVISIGCAYIIPQTEKKSAATTMSTESSASNANNIQGFDASQQKGDQAQKSEAQGAQQQSAPAQGK